uniref:SH3 domain-binding glutamic acid-rich-like protein 3 n=1 Tax=Equus caballus TaxID=9796 RepID=A0A0B4J1B8_HORSE
VERKCGENLLSGAVPVLVCLLSRGVSHVWVSPEGVGRGSVERGSLAWELQVWKQHKPSKPSCATCSRGSESSDSRAEQEGNRSRARRRRLQAVELPLPPPVRLSARPSTRSMSGLRVYSTSVTGSREIKSQQSEVTRILDGKRIQYQLVDISQDNALRDEMRALAGNPKATPPQIVNGDQYCGDYELFVEAVEQNTLQEFLKLA